MKFNIDTEVQFYCQITPNGYDHKPNQKETGVIQESISPTLITINDFIAKISRGYAYRAGEKRKESFTNFQIVSLDIDGCPTPMNEYIKNLKDKPTIAYTSPSNGKEECQKPHEDGIYRFRLIYVSDSILSGYERYGCILDYLIEANKMTYTDARSYPAVHYFNGNASRNIEVYSSGYVYNFSDIDVFLYDNHTESTSNKDFYEPRKEGEKKATRLSEKLVALGVCSEFAHDCETMALMKFRNKWLIRVWLDIKGLKYSSDYIDDIHPYAEIAPDDYKETLHYKIWDSNTKCLINKKWRDGQNRHGKIFYSSRAIKELNPNLTLEQFISLTVDEYLEEYDNKNKDGSVKYTLKSFVETIALPAWESEDPLEFTPQHPKIHVKDEAVTLTGKTKKQLAPTILSDLRREPIMKDYDKSISIDKNLQIFKERGIKVSRSTLIRYLKKQRELLEK